MATASNSKRSAVRSSLEQLSETWRRDLRSAIVAHPQLPSSDVLVEEYISAFPPEYQATFSVEQCVADLEVMSTLTKESPLTARIEPRHPLRSPAIGGSNDETATATVVLYNQGADIPLSKSLPILENMGLEVLTVSSVEIVPDQLNRVAIHRMLVRPKFDTEPESSSVFSPGSSSIALPSSVSHGLCEIIAGRAENDLLNALLIRSTPITDHFDVEAIGLLRAYSCLLWQLIKFATRGAIFEALVAEPQVAVLLWRFFITRFDPAFGTAEDRTPALQSLEQQCIELLASVREINRDRILRSLLSLIKHTVRTNFFHRQGRALTLKLHSEKIDIIPQPRPKFELFIRSPLFEGTHLRADSVARGGIRWSERNDDYRTEVLGLMNTQRIKNVVIVPNGAKGGFAIRYLPKDQKEVYRTVEQCYREYIRACLSVTDNRVGDAIIHPQGLVIYDEPDPYFVVAADKGTATFSDIANEIAVNEYQFWLGDAFASGGSKGYDHKLYGITARGAWECVRRHFHDLGIHYERDPFSVIGIGDMSGDVFGNGLLMSDKAKLIAAFNHIHIFIDPSPDPAASFKERKRLFEMPRSNWTDYDKNIISTGGGVFGRFDKEITLTPEMRAAFAVPEETPATLNGEELINLILQAPCDLLWNGGIGTYVKASIESHSDVSDRHNDRVRINATELRARVIGEGGNLGLTQRARVEAGMAGVALNTDAIDNSAGVDLSDHEVNLKILFAGLIQEGTITLEQRDALMLEIADEVTQQVLDHNRSHAVMLSLSVNRSKKSLSYVTSLLRHLSRLGYVSRRHLVLPDDATLEERDRRHLGLSRPELSVCLASVKMWIKDILGSSNLIKDPIFRRYLAEYFPTTVRHRFSKEILRHPLWNHIIATEVTSKLVDAVGITFVHRMCTNHSVPPLTVIKCALAADEILGLSEIRSALSTFDNSDENTFFLTSRREVSGSLRDVTAWLIARHGHELSLEGMVSQYRAAFLGCVDQSDDILVGENRALCNNRYRGLLEKRLEAGVARRIAIIPVIVNLLEMIRISQRTGTSVGLISAVDAQIIAELSLAPYAIITRLPETKDKWEHQLLLSTYDDIRRQLSYLTERLVGMGILSPGDVSERIRRSPNYEMLTNIVEEINGSRTPSVAAVGVLAKHLRGIGV
jgi:glutamate dehydrogenase